MKVKDLIELLQTMPEDADVILQKDAEGNGFSPLEGADADCVYVPYNTWCGEVYDTRWTADDADMDEDEWNDLLSLPRSVVLFPVN